MLAQGAHVVAIHHPAEREAAREWRQNIVIADAEALHVEACDVADYAATDSLFERLALRDVAVDVLVNAAGITRDAPLKRMGLEQWQAVLRVNLDSVFNVCRCAIQSMIDRGYGRIVNISSVNGQKGQYGQANYAAAKAGMHGLTMSLAQEVAASGITVNTVSPGYIDSPMVQAVPEHVRERIKTGIPVGRFGMPQDIARAVAFLVAKDASFITGIDLSVNGGLHMG